MGVNIKFGDSIYNNVSQLKVADADNIGTYDTFIYGSGINVQSLKTVTVQSAGTVIISPDSGYDALTQVEVNVNITNKPTLNAPVISTVNGRLIIDDTANGNFATEYLIYKDDEVLCASTSKQVELANYLTANSNNIFKIKATANGFNNSEFSNSIKVN